jgi:phage-related protein
MEKLKLDTSSIKGKMVGDWRIDEVQDQLHVYALHLSNNGSDKLFFIRKQVIKGESLNLQNDVYEIWYENYKDGTILTLSEISNPDTLINSINSLINRYSQFD